MFDAKKILYAINLDSANIVPVVTALKIAQSFGSEIHFLYVNDPQAGFRHPADREDAVALRLRDMAPDELLSSVSVIYATAKGDLAEEVAKYCADNGIDLVIVGHKLRPKIYGKVFDSSDVKIIDAINLPVLVLPTK
jgi:nucleotide-binding universal stress UspA family protein